MSKIVMDSLEFVSGDGGVGGASLDLMHYSTRLRKLMFGDVPAEGAGKPLNLSDAQRPSNCRSCGAPWERYRCSYCGSEH